MDWLSFCTGKSFTFTPHHTKQSAKIKRNQNAAHTLPSTVRRKQHEKQLKRLLWKIQFSDLEFIKGGAFHSMVRGSVQTLCGPDSICLKSIESEIVHIILCGIPDEYEKWEKQSVRCDDSISVREDATVLRVCFVQGKASRCARTLRKTNAIPHFSSGNRARKGIFEPRGICVFVRVPVTICWQQKELLDVSCFFRWKISITRTWISLLGRVWNHQITTWSGSTATKEACRCLKTVYLSWELRLCEICCSISFSSRVLPFLPSGYYLWRQYETRFNFQSFYDNWHLQGICIFLHGEGKKWDPLFFFRTHKVEIKSNGARCRIQFIVVSLDIHRVWIICTIHG